MDDRAKVIALKQATWLAAEQAGVVLIGVEAFDAGHAIGAAVRRADGKMNGVRQPTATYDPVAVVDSLKHWLAERPIEDVALEAIRDLALRRA